MRFSVIAGTVLALSVVGAVMLGAGERAAKREHLAQELAGLRAAGLLPAEGDVSVKEASPYLQRIDALQQTIPPRTEAASDITDFAAAREFTEAHSAALDKLEEVILGPLGQAAVLERGGHNPNIARLMRARGTANALCMRAVVAASEGRGADALRSLSAAFDYSYTIDHGSLINLMVEISVDGTVAKTWQRIDMEFGAQLGVREFADALGPRLVRSLSHDRVTLGMRGDLQSFVENFGGLTELSADASEQCLHILQHYREMLENSEYDCTLPSSPKTVECDFGCHIGGILSSARTSVHYNFRGYQLTRLALAIGAHRVDVGDWPATLAELELEDPAAIDPCTRQAFSYEVTENEVHLWSEPLPPSRGYCCDDRRNNNALLDWRWKR